MNYQIKWLPEIGWFLLPIAIFIGAEFLAGGDDVFNNPQGWAIATGASAARLLVANLVAVLRNLLGARNG